MIEVVKFNNYTKTRNLQRKNKKISTLESINALYEGKEMVLNAFKSWIFPFYPTEGIGLKILTPREILQDYP